ncbi:LacI family DNA-binding transcriptional regulator [Microbacterium sp. 22215]|uniref:LacI family DNA-binding transcriptional regulator n=1 Tax=Microbacterium sp. 22215 TaxID=3453893 RepID=UPI003F83DA1A
MVTIHDVAKAAGVSPMTVSHVVNEHRNVRESTREHVLEVISQLGYRVNVAARNLRTGRTGTVGLAVPEIDRPYYGLLSAAIIAAAAKHGLRVAIEQTGALRERELDALALSRNRLYDGIILSTVGLGQADTDLLKVDYPVVILGERIFQGPVDHVAMANVDGARAATTHLINGGRRRIAIIDAADREDGVASLRLAGYKAALEDSGIPFDPDLVAPVDLFTMQAGADAARELTVRRPDVDALFCVTDTLAFGAMRGLTDVGVAIPKQVAVIGFDNVAESGFSIPSLSTVDPDHQAMADAALRYLVQRINGYDQAAREFISPFTVIERESSGIVLA